MVLRSVAQSQPRYFAIGWAQLPQPTPPFLLPPLLPTVTSVPPACLSPPLAFASCYSLLSYHTWAPIPNEWERSPQQAHSGPPGEHPYYRRRRLALNRALRLAIFLRQSAQACARRAIEK